LLIAEAVARRGVVSKQGLADVMAEDLAITVPSGRLRLVRRMANVASVLGSVNKLDGHNGWEAGEEKPIADGRWQEWTMNSLRQRATVLVGEADDPAETLASELFNGHPTKLAKYVAALAVEEAHRARSVAG